MTSRARRIVLAMWGHKKPEPVAVTPPVGKPWIFAVVDSLPSRGCYEAMDDVDDIMPRLTADGAWIIPPAPRYYDTHCYCCDGPPPRDVDPITADLPRSPIVGGNYGLPCA